MSARLDRLALDQLQSVCHSKGLPVGGTKAELVARIEAAPSSRGGGATRVRMAAQSLGELTVYQLKAVCRAKGLPVSGRSPTWWRGSRRRRRARRRRRRPPTPMRRSPTTSSSRGRAAR